MKQNVNNDVTKDSILCYSNLRVRFQLGPKFFYLLSLVTSHFLLLFGAISKNVDLVNNAMIGTLIQL